MLFAPLKSILRLDRLRLRGPSGAKDEFLLAATAQILQKLAAAEPLSAISAQSKSRGPACRDCRRLVDRLLARVLKQGKGSPGVTPAPPSLSSHKLRRISAYGNPARF